jgi:hypothetical protein
MEPDFYEDHQSPEDGRATNSLNVVYIKYISGIG